MNDFTDCRPFFMAGFLAGETPLMIQEGRSSGGSAIAKYTSFKIPSYSAAYFPIKSQEDRLCIKNLRTGGSNAFYAVQEESDFRLDKIHKNLTKTEGEFRRIFNIGTSQPVLVYDDNGHIHRGVVSDRLEKVRVYLVDSGKTVDVPYGEVLAIPKGHWLRDRQPLAFRFIIDGLPEDYCMTKEEAEGIAAYTLNTSMYIRIRGTFTDENNLGGFRVSLHIRRSPSGPEEDLRELIMARKFKEV